MLAVTIVGLLVIAAGAGCSDDDEDVNSSDSLTISNVQVSEITETTAVVSWTTDVQATSEVIYECST